MSEQYQISVSVVCKSINILMMRIQLWFAFENISFPYSHDIFTINLCRFNSELRCILTLFAKLKDILLFSGTRLSRRQFSLR